MLAQTSNNIMGPASAIERMRSMLLAFEFYCYRYPFHYHYPNPSPIPCIVYAEEEYFFFQSRICIIKYKKITFAFYQSLGNGITFLLWTCICVCVCACWLSSFGFLHIGQHGVWLILYWNLYAISIRPSDYFFSSLLVSFPHH